MKPGAQLELITAAEASADPAVKARWEKQQAAWAATGDALAPYSFALAGGNAWRGAGQFYENPVLPCARCHKVNGEGGEAGPDLTLIAKEKSTEYLLESIIKPSAHIAAGFDVVSFTLKNGETETGSLASESPTQIVLKRADSTTVNIDPKQVKERVTAPSSMPEIYGQVLTRAQLRDLMAFMQVLGRTDRGAGETALRQEQSRDGLGDTGVAVAGGHP